MLDFIRNYFIIIPIIFMIITIIILIKIIIQKIEFVETEGKIIDIYENNRQMFLNDCEHKAVSPIIAFEVNGVNIEFIGNYYSTMMKKGDKVKVLYNPKCPRKAKIKTGVYFSFIILSVFTLFSFIAYIIIRYVFK